MTLINSMDMPTYMIMLLVIFGMDVYGLIKYRKVKALWKVPVYLQPVTLDCYGHKQSYKGIRTVYSFT